MDGVVVYFGIIDFNPLDRRCLGRIRLRGLSCRGDCFFHSSVVVNLRRGGGWLLCDWFGL